MAAQPNPDWGMTGKVAIVTGGGAAGDGIGNGRAAAILLAGAGARVLVVDRDVALAERTVAMIAEDGGEAAAFAADVTEEDHCAAMVGDAVARWGRLDYLDNNVGIASRGSVVDEAADDWRRVMRVNVEAMFLAAKCAIPAMRRAGGGAIVNVASIAALRPRGMTSYSTSKGAVIALSRAMAVDHGPDGIRVNCVAPGPVYTPMVQGDGMSAEARAPPPSLRARTGGHRLGCWPSGAFPAQRSSALYHRSHAGGRWRRDPGQPRPLVRRSTGRHLIESRFR